MDGRTAVETELLVGEQLRRLRIDAGLTQAQLAAAADLAVPTVRQLENGRGARLNTLIRVLRVLDRDDWFDELNPVPPTSPMQTLLAARGQKPRQRVRPRKNN